MRHIAHYPGQHVHPLLAEGAVQNDYFAFYEQGYKAGEAAFARGNRPGMGHDPYADKEMRGLSPEDPGYFAFFKGWNAGYAGARTSSRKTASQSAREEEVLEYLWDLLLESSDIHYWLQPLGEPNYRGATFDVNISGPRRGWWIEGGLHEPFSGAQEKYRITGSDLLRGVDLLAQNANRFYPEWLGQIANACKRYIETGDDTPYPNEEDGEMWDAGDAEFIDHVAQFAAFGDVLYG